MRWTFLTGWKDYLWLAAGICAGALGLKGFLLPAHFFDGGATGIALIVAESTRLEVAHMILLVNIPFVVLGYLQMSRRFIIRTIVGVSGLSLVIALVEVPVVTTDPILASVFGGFFLGAGIGLSIRGGGVIDGTEIVALFVSRRINVSVGDIIMGMNIVIFGVAALLFGIEVAMYSMIAYFVASKTVDFIIQGIEEYLWVTIISQKPHAIQERIVAEMGMGVTVLNGKGGHGNRGQVDQEAEILFSVITRLELLKVRRIIDEEDPQGFVIIHGVRDVKGGMLRKRKLPT